jgi:coproporphyrinogen III oxidase-like Fe-S oxidoreductase
VIDRYVAALELDIASGPGWRPLDAVFVGGGTPSRLPASRLGRILEALGENHGLAAGAEVTLEANPEDIDEAAATALREVGFNRISLGVQSFDDTVLSTWGACTTRGRQRGRYERGPRRRVRIGVGRPDLRVAGGDPGVMGPHPRRRDREP